MSGTSGRHATFAVLVMGCCAVLIALGQLRGPAASASPDNSAPAARVLQPYPGGVTLNEFMPHPVSDWNDDGIISETNDEYIEIHNANAFAVDLSGWMLDDADVPNTDPYILPPGTIIQPFDVRVFFSAETGVRLNNTGDSARLLFPDGTLVDEYIYSASQVGDDVAFSRTINGGGEWTTTYPPSPGSPNLPPPPTSTPTATPTPTTGPTATPFPSGITLNEFMPDPVSDWNGNGQTGDDDDEYIEIYNANSSSVDLSGWKLDDVEGNNDGPFTLPAGSMIPAHGFLVFFSEQTDFALNNGGDSVRLLHPDNSIADETTYSATQPDQAHSRTIDGGGIWVTTYPPSPGQSNQPPPTNTPTATYTPTATATETAPRTPTSTATHTGTPTATATPAPTVDAISLNEFMPDPVTDWNGNGQTGDSDDEYIELYNSQDLAVDLSGWKLDDRSNGGSPPFTLPAGSTIPARGFLVFFSNQTHISLNNSGGDSVRLLRPDGSEVEAYAYTANAPDEAYSKTSDGGTSWTTSYPPSPGSANLAGPTPTPGASSALAGHVFVDADADGVYEPWMGEQGLAGVLVILDDSHSYLTNDSGWYGFFNLAPGQHTVRHAQPVHMASTTANEYTVTVEPGATVDELNFGQTPLPAAQIDSPVMLNEFLPSPASDWDGNGVADADDEWIELYNAGDTPIDVSGWWLDDEDDSQLRTPEGSVPYMLPLGSLIPAHGFLVVFRSTSGVALNNSGDDVRLVGPAYYEVEAFNFGSTGYDVSWSKTEDGGDLWINSYPPSPGASNQPGSATATATTTATATATPTAGGTPTPLPDGISLNEYLPDPASDWDGNGVVNAEDEYVEIYNANSFAVDLSGWMLDDLAGSGSQPYHFPAGTTLAGQGFLLVFRSQSGVALNNDGDSVRLLGPDGSLIEETSYDTSDDDLAYSKLVEGSSLWTDVYPPSPGLPNLPGPTVTPTSTPTATPTGSPTPTPSATPPPNFGIVLLNEFMPDPASDWNGDGTPDAADEYIELFNPGPTAVDLGGWALDDEDDGASGVVYLYAPEGTQPYVIPDGTMIQPSGFLLFFRSETGVALNNDGDWVRLLRPDGSVAETFEYFVSHDDEAYSKTTDGGASWTTAYPPSPGVSNTADVTPTPPPTTPTPYPTSVSLNEFMPEPASDWNGDGANDSGDEYIELYNAAAAPVDLSGWYLDDTDSALAAPDLTTPYQIPPDTTIPPRGFLVFFRSDTGVALNNDSADSVRLLWPDGSEVERRDYVTTAPDRSVSKEHEGGATWTELYPPSPGGPNLPGFTGNEQVRLNELLPSPRDV
ncbi:MAG: lamin tail domain-containing protein, partial [Anaerolineae bacterium]|nr:lamin tail domain-containing protein [Anaerolineae bacterium]